MMTRGDGFAVQGSLVVVIGNVAVVIVPALVSDVAKHVKVVIVAAIVVLIVMVQTLMASTRFRKIYVGDISNLMYYCANNLHRTKIMLVHPEV